MVDLDDSLYHNSYLNFNPVVCLNIGKPDDCVKIWVLLPLGLFLFHSRAKVVIICTVICTCISVYSSAVDCLTLFYTNSCQQFWLLLLPRYFFLHIFFVLCSLLNSYFNVQHQSFSVVYNVVTTEE